METTPEEPVEETATPLEQLVGEDAPAEPMEEITPEEAGEPPAPETPPAAAASEPEAPKEPFWYRKTLREKEAANKAMQRELEELRARTVQPAPELANPVDDPAAYHQQVQQAAEWSALNAKLDTSELLARDKHGDDAVDEAMEWVNTRPDIRQWALGQRHPYQALLNIYNREKLASEIGDNPAEWRAKERELLRAEILAEAQQPAQNGMTPQPSRPMIPGPGSQARSASPKGAWNGPQPVQSILKNSFGA